MNRNLLLLLMLGTTLVLGGLFAIVRIGTPPQPQALTEAVTNQAENDRKTLDLAARSPSAHPTGNSTRGHIYHPSHLSHPSHPTLPGSAAQPGSFTPQATSLMPQTLNPSADQILTPEQEIEAANADLERSAQMDQADNVARFSFPGDNNTITSDPKNTKVDQKITAKLAKKEAKLRDKNGGISGQEAERSDTPALDAFQIALGFQGSDKFSYGKVVKAVQGMQAQEFPQAAADLQNLEWNKESHYMMNALMKQWGKTDLDAALNAADTMDIRRMQSDARREAMEGWTSHNPNEAYNMLLAGEDQNPLAEYVSPAKVFRNLAEANPQAALDKVWNLPETSQQNSALAGVLSALPADERHNAARSLYQQAPTPESQSMLARAVVNDLRIYRPTEAAAFVDSIQEPAIRKSVSSTLISSWATDDPTEAMDWAASHPPSEQTERDVSSVASRWVRNDPNELGDWLNQQPATATLDPAVQALVRVEQKENPSTAMGWAESIVDPKDRVTSVRSVAAAWMKTDPATATTYILNHAELSEKDKERLLR